MDGEIIKEYMYLKNELLEIIQDVDNINEEYYKLLIALKKCFNINNEVIFNEEFIKNQNLLNDVRNNIDSVIFLINNKI